MVADRSDQAFSEKHLRRRPRLQFRNHSLKASRLVRDDGALSCGLAARAPDRSVPEYRYQPEAHHNDRCP